MLGSTTSRATDVASRFRRLAGAVVAAALTATFLTPALSPAGATPDPATTDLAIAFNVVNTNTSSVACPADVQPYRVQGHLTGPSDALAHPIGGTAALYLHGFDATEYSWRLRDVDGYDHVAEMARLGHVSVTIERLGYDTPRPHGGLSCVGASADIVHQIVTHLRRGSYEIESGPPVAFSRVVLVGHDTGGAIAQTTAYSYGDIDGLVVLSYHNQGVTEQSRGAFGAAMAVCARGGEAAETDTPGGGYFRSFYPDDDDVRAFAFADAEPAVVDAHLARREKDACGELISTAAEVFTGADDLARVHVPVLLLHGDEDVGFDPARAAEQTSHYRGSDDVTFRMLERTGHFPFFERSAPTMRSVLSDWLHARWPDPHPDVGSTSVFATVGYPGHPGGIVVDGDTVYTSTFNPVFQALDGYDAIFAYDRNTGALRTDRPNPIRIPRRVPATVMGLAGMTVDADGDLYVADMTGRVLRVDPATGQHEDYAVMPNDTATSLTSMPGDVEFDEAGNLYVTDSSAPVIWRVPPGGGSAELFLTAVTGGTGTWGYGLSGLTLDATREWLYFSANVGNSAAIHRVPIDQATPERVELVHLYEPDAPGYRPETSLEGLFGVGGLTFGGSGRLYVMLLGRNQVSVLDPGGVEVARFPEAARRSRNEAPYDDPLFAGFDGSGHLLVTNGSFRSPQGLGPSTANDVVLRAWVDDIAAAPERPGVPATRPQELAPPVPSAVTISPYCALFPPTT